MYEAIIIIRNSVLLLFSFSLSHNVLTDFNKNSYYEILQIGLVGAALL
jgi:hypothetical protein